MITAKVLLTQSLRGDRQFAATTGSEHHMLLDDAAGEPDQSPSTWWRWGCLHGIRRHYHPRQKYHQKVTGYEVRVEADQAERPRCLHPYESVVWSRLTR
jgi:hypothetical protein